MKNESRKLHHCVHALFKKTTAILKETQGSQPAAGGAALVGWRKKREVNKISEQLALFHQWENRVKNRGCFNFSSLLSLKPSRCLKS